MLLYAALILPEQVVPCDIVEPLSAAVMPEYPWPFYKFIGTQQKINPHHRELDHKRRQESERNPIAPHDDRITDKSEPAVAPCPKGPRDQRGIDRHSHDVICIDPQHAFQIMHGLRA